MYKALCIFLACSLRELSEHLLGRRIHLKLPRHDLIFSSDPCVLSVHGCKLPIHLAYGILNRISRLQCRCHHLNAVSELIPELFLLLFRSIFQPFPDIDPGQWNQKHCRNKRFIKKVEDSSQYEDPSYGPGSILTHPDILQP